MDPSLQYIIQWVRSGAPQAKDPRLKLFGSLFRSSTVDPHSLKVISKKSGELVIQGTLQYSSPDIAELKKKKIVIKRATKDIAVSMEAPKPDATVLISHSRSMFMLSFEEVLMLCNLYVIFTDKRKMELFQKLLQGE